MQIEECEGYKKLKAAILADTKSGRSESERMQKLEFAVSRAQHYEQKTGVPASEVLTAWENGRNYWYMNYYQDAEQPLIEGDSVRVFETTDELVQAIGKNGFRCPNCNGISKSPYACDSGVKLKLINSKGPEPCNWKVGGLFRALGKGVYVFVKAELKGEMIFMPIAWEPETQYFIVDIRNDWRKQKYITFWRPDNSNYAWPLSWAGRYDRSVVDSQPSYYCNTNGGKSLVRFPVACEIVEAMALTEPDNGDIDGNVGPVLRNSEKVRRKLRASAYIPKRAVTTGVSA